MRSAGSEPAGRDPGQPGLVALPVELRSGSGHGQGRKREPSRTAGKAGPAPIEISRRVLGVLLLTALLALVILVVLAPGVLFVALGGLALALALSFPVRALSRFMPRPLAVAATFLVLISAAILALVVLIPLLSGQLAALFAAAPGIATDAERTLRGLLEPLAERGVLPGTPDELLTGLAADLYDRARTLAEGLLGGFFGFAGRAFSVAIGLVAALVIAAYLLADVRKIKAAFLRASPKTYRRDALELWESFAFSLSRYLSGLAFVMVVQGALSALVLWLLGIPYAALLGAWVAVTAVVPLLGAWIGAIPAVLVALSVSPTVALLTALLFLAIQQLEGNFLTPRVMGGVLGIHPVLILLGVIGGSQLAGPLGILFAVPTLAVLRVLFDFLRPRLRVRRSDEPGHDTPSLSAISHQRSAISQVQKVDGRKPTVRFAEGPPFRKPL